MYLFHFSFIHSQQPIEESWISWPPYLASENDWLKSLKLFFYQRAFDDYSSSINVLAWHKEPTVQTVWHLLSVHGRPRNYMKLYKTVRSIGNIRVNRPHHTQRLVVFAWFLCHQRTYEKPSRLEFEMNLPTWKFPMSTLSFWHLWCT